MKYLWLWNEAPLPWSESTALDAEGVIGFSRADTSELAVRRVLRTIKATCSESLTLDLYIAYANDYALPV